MRIRSFDVLRGLAIAVMFIDHYFALSYGMSIEPFNPRFIARIAEPLFAFLFGYFLFNRSIERVFLRALQVSVAAIIVNAFFYLLTGKFEILVSFLIMYVLYVLLRDNLWIGVFALPLFNIDPTYSILDYPLSIVAFQVGLMFAYRKFGIKSLLLLLIGLYSLFIPQPYNYVIWFSFLSYFLVLFAEKYRNLSFEPLEVLGRNPLKAYVLQYIIAIVIAIIILMVG